MVNCHDRQNFTIYFCDLLTNFIASCNRLMKFTVNFLNKKIFSRNWQTNFCNILPQLITNYVTDRRNSLFFSHNQSLKFVIFFPHDQLATFTTFSSGRLVKFTNNSLHMIENFLFFSCGQQINIFHVFFLVIIRQNSWFPPPPWMIGEFQILVRDWQNSWLIHWIQLKFFFFFPPRATEKFYDILLQLITEYRYFPATDRWNSLFSCDWLSKFMIVFPVIVQQILQFLLVTDWQNSGLIPCIHLKIFSFFFFFPLWPIDWQNSCFFLWPFIRIRDFVFCDRLAYFIASSCVRLINFMTKSLDTIENL